MGRFALVLSIGWLSSACAFSDVQLTLPTQKLENRYSGGNGRQVIVAVPFSDEREIRDRCGMKKNGYNMDTADAICESDPNVWIAELLARELRRSGFTVLEEGAAHRPGALRIEGSLIKIFVEPVIGVWTGSLEADLSVPLRATSDTGLDAKRTFFIKRRKPGEMFATERPYNTA